MGDGDYHIKVTDTATGTVLITELMPQWQQLGIKPPSVGQSIKLVGYVFCDTCHHTPLTC